jgi:ubiquinone/menaquinone biosynthesis C-methylase UbiE
MRRPPFIAEQSARPQGLLGRLIAFLMEKETADHNRRALDALAIQDGDDVLELGYGHGRTLELIASLTPSGAIAGIDHSEQMRDIATQRCNARLGAGRVDVRTGDTRRLPYPDQSFSCVLAVHVLYFWSDPLQHLREVHRVLRNGGRFVIGFRDKRDPAAANFPAPLYTFYDTVWVRERLAQAGFRSSEIADDSPACTILQAMR